MDECLRRNGSGEKMKHDLKTVSPHFEQVQSGEKTFELRYNDRNYQVGDLLHLRHYDGNYTGPSITVEVTHILDNFPGLKPGWIIMSIK